MNPAWIQERRKAMGFSVEALARQVNLSTSYMTDVIRAEGGRALSALKPAGQRLVEILGE